MTGEEKHNLYAALHNLNLFSEAIGRYRAVEDLGGDISNEAWDRAQVGVVTAMNRLLKALKLSWKGFEAVRERAKK